MAVKTYLNYIDGEWTPSTAGQTFDLIDRQPGKLLPLRSNPVLPI